MSGTIFRFDRMSRCGFALVLAACIALPMPVFAGVADPSAESFLATIYRSYVGKSRQEAKGIALENAATVRRYFSAGLASLILDDSVEANGRGVPPALGGDPFVGRQDWQISDLSIDVKEYGPVKATGIVAFTNFGQPAKIVLELMKVGDAWRIADIQWDSGSLRGLYRRK